jgi:hypothetical protein
LKIAGDWYLMTCLCGFSAEYNSISKRLQINANGDITARHAGIYFELGGKDGTPIPTYLVQKVDEVVKKAW